MLEELLLELHARPLEKLPVIFMVRATNGWQATVRDYRESSAAKNTAFAVTPTGALELAVRKYLAANKKGPPTDLDDLI